MPASIRQAFRNKAFGRVFPAVPIPWTADGRMHEAAQEKYVEYMTTSGVGGAAVWAHTGRGLHIPWSERIRVMKSWRQGFSDGRLLIAGVGALPDRSLSDAAMKTKFMEETIAQAQAAAAQSALDLRELKAPFSGTVLELTYNYGVDSYEMGGAFGHIAIAVDDAYAACERIRAAGGNVTREPGPVKGGTTVIAFVTDPDGYKIELIQARG